jgi:hypothetical protein
MCEVPRTDAFSPDQIFANANVARLLRSDGGTTGNSREASYGPTRG